MFFLKHIADIEILLAWKLFSLFGRIQIYKIKLH